MFRQINAGVLCLINEVELSIYRFLTSGAKKNKKQPQPIKLGVDQFTSCLSIQCFGRLPFLRPDLDRERGYLDREGKATGRERESFCTPRLGKGNRSTGTLDG